MGPAFLRRSSRHPEPVLDLTLFRSRSFSVANAATFLYAMGFFAMLLGNILFLTSVWHYSILKAGLAVTPGPLVVAVVVGAGRAAGRPRRLPAGPARRVRGLRRRTVVVRHPGRPATPTTWPSGCPATLITGLGIGLTFPVLSAAAVSSLHAERFAVGSAVNQTARQVGVPSASPCWWSSSAPRPVPTPPSPASTTCWWYCAGTAALAGLLCTLLAPGRPAGALGAETQRDLDRPAAAPADHRRGSLTRPESPSRARAPKATSGRSGLP